MTWNPGPGYIYLNQRQLFGSRMARWSELTLLQCVMSGCTAYESTSIVGYVWVEFDS